MPVLFTASSVLFSSSAFSQEWLTSEVSSIEKPVFSEDPEADLSFEVLEEKSGEKKKGEVVPQKKVAKAPDSSKLVEFPKGVTKDSGKVDGKMTTVPGQTIVRDASNLVTEVPIEEAPVNDLALFLDEGASAEEIPVEPVVPVQSVEAASLVSPERVLDTAEVVVSEDLEDLEDLPVSDLSLDSVVMEKVPVVKTPVERVIAKSDDVNGLPVVKPEFEELVSEEPLIGSLPPVVEEVPLIGEDPVAEVDMSKLTLVERLRLSRERASIPEPELEDSVVVVPKSGGSEEGSGVDVYYDDEVEVYELVETLDAPPVKWGAPAYEDDSRGGRQLGYYRSMRPVYNGGVYTP